MKGILDSRKRTSMFFLIVSAGALAFVVSLSMPLALATTSDTTTEETSLANTIMSYLTEAETSVAAGNTTEASDKLGVAIGVLSNLIGDITSDDGKYNDTHTHYVTHDDKTTHIVHTHPHNSDHHHNNWFQQHHEFNPSHCTPGLMC